MPSAYLNYISRLIKLSAEITFPYGEMEKLKTLGYGQANYLNLITQEMIDQVPVLHDAGITVAKLANIAAAVEATRTVVVNSLPTFEEWANLH